MVFIILFEQILSGIRLENNNFTLLFSRDRPIRKNVNIDAKNQRTPEIHD